MQITESTRQCNDFLWECNSLFMFAYNHLRVVAAAQCLCGLGRAFSLQLAGRQICPGPEVLQELHMHCTVNNPIAKAQAYTTPTGQTMSPCSREKQRHHWSFQASRGASALLACLPFQSGTEGQEGSIPPHFRHGTCFRMFYSCSVDCIELPVFIN